MSAKSIDSPRMAIPNINRKGPTHTIMTPAIPKLGFIKPAPSTRNTVASPSATISDGGQILFNKPASIALQGFTSCIFLADTNGKVNAEGVHQRNTNWVGIKGVDKAKLPKDVSEEDVYNITWLKIKGTEQRTHAQIAASRSLRSIGYDYNASGRQIFSPVYLDDKQHQVMFELPSGQLTPRPVQTRKRTAKAVTGATNGSNGSGEGAMDVDAPEEVLQEA